MPDESPVSRTTGEFALRAVMSGVIVFVSPRALRDDADADPPRRPCEAVRRRHRPRLVAGGVVRHLEIVLEVVQDPRVPRAHDAEDVGRALGRQGSRDRLREGHLRRHLGHSLSPSTVAFPDATTLFTQQNL
jgi:hypothetical protein